jgi:hypothetical protein
MPLAKPDAAAWCPGREPKYSMCFPTARLIEMDGHDVGHPYKVVI